MLNIHRILVPVDFSEYCSRALAYAHELAATHHADIDVVHVIEEPTFPAFYKVGEEALYGRVATIRERAQEALRECVASVEGVDFEDGFGFHIETGKPDEKIIELANEHDADLIVISTHGLSGVERVLMGSVADKIVRNAPCPVFVVKSFGKSLLPSEARQEASL